MANTYYDSELTAEEIEAVLEAINGILTQANNGKVLAINNGKIEARSVQWSGGSTLEPLSVTANGDYYPESGVDGFDEVHVAVPSGSPTIQSLSVTQNGTYTAPSGVDGYSPVVVNVSGGGGGKKEFLYEFNESQGGAWINTNVSVSNIETLCFDDVRSGDVIKYVVIDVSDIAVYTGGADVYTLIFTQTRPMNARIYNGNLYVSYNGTGPATNVTKVYKYTEAGITYTFADDGNGNITIAAVPGDSVELVATDDGNGNITIQEDV